MNKSTNILISLVTLFCALLVTADTAEAQGRKTPSRPRVKKVIAVDAGVAVGTAGGSASTTFASEPYLGLEPCAKETDEQIAELENAKDLNAQLVSLLRRGQDTDRWTRGCAVYRLGEFGRSAQNALPLILKLVRDEKDSSVWSLTEEALWKIPPDDSLPLEQRLRLTKDPDVYRRIYGVYVVGYFRLVPNSFQAKDVVKALIEATSDEDVTVRWLAVMGIRQQGFNGNDTSAAIPALVELLSNGKLNPLHAVRAFVPMGEKGLPAAPALFDVLFNSKKYVRGDDDNNVRSYSLYSTAAIALGRMGPKLMPLLEEQVGKEPYRVIRVLSHLSHDRAFALLLKLAESPDAEIRAAALEGFPGMTSIGAMQALPILVKLIDDPNEEVANKAYNKLGNIGQFTEQKSPELVTAIRKTVVPKLTAKLSSKNNCYPLMILGSFGENAAIALPKVVRIFSKGNYCAETALYRYGPIGQKFLTREKLEYHRETGKSGLIGLPGSGISKAKPIKPKVPAPPAEKVTTKDG